MTTTKYLWPAPGMKLRDANMAFIPEDGAELPLDTLTYRRLAARELLEHDPRKGAPTREAFPNTASAVSPEPAPVAGMLQASETSARGDAPVRETFEREG